jgi:hypothetical protein
MNLDTDTDKTCNTCVHQQCTEMFGCRVVTLCDIHGRVLTRYYCNDWKCVVGAGMSDSMKQLTTWAMIGQNFRKVAEDREQRAREMIKALSESEYEQLLDMCDGDARERAIRLRGE